MPSLWNHEDTKDTKKAKEEKLDGLIHGLLTFFILRALCAFVVVLRFRELT